MKEMSPYHETIFKILIERTNNICFAYNVVERKFIYINTALEYFFKLTDDEINRNSSLLLQALSEDDLPYAIEKYQQLLREHNIAGITLRTHVGDDIRELKLEAWLIHIDGTPIIAGVADDISKEKEQLSVLNKFAEKKNSILEIVSHDLTGPLGNIKLCIELLLLQPEIAHNKIVLELLDKITRNSERSLNLIRNFLKRELLETFEATLVKTRIDIVEKINNFIDEFRKAESVLNKSILFLPDVDSMYVLVDEPKFIQVLQNLVSNALKFTHDGGTIKISLSETDTDMLISVEDNGIGIPEHLQKDIFEKFSGARRPGLKGEQSVGLGMSIIKRIVDWHNGRIWFKSQENKGTTFYVQIPKESKSEIV